MEKKLRRVIPKQSGRGATGEITTRHQGGREKRFFRVIDWKREKRDMPAVVEGIEYDPNRSADIALILYPDGERRYILAPDGLKTGQLVSSGEAAPLTSGNALPLRAIQVGNTEWKNTVWGKAGRRRHLGIRPTVRGTAQNPRSHPHGGGEGRSGEGMHPKTPWGKSARGTKTRRKTKYSDKLIVQKR